jgi:hypothetical protein
MTIRSHLGLGDDPYNKLAKLPPQDVTPSANPDVVSKPNPDFVSKKPAADEFISSNLGPKNRKINDVVGWESLAAAAEEPELLTTVMKSDAPTSLQREVTDKKIIFDVQAEFMKITGPNASIS